MKGPGFTIICAKCGVPVPIVEWETDMATDLVRMTAYCHGQKDTRRFDPADISGSAPGLVGLAFDTPILPASERQGDAAVQAILNTWEKGE